MVNFYNKYLKYKSKYLDLYNKIEGGSRELPPQSPPQRQQPPQRPPQKPPPPPKKIEQKIDLIELNSHQNLNTLFFQEDGQTLGKLKNVVDTSTIQNSITLGFEFYNPVTKMPGTNTLVFEKDKATNKFEFKKNKSKLPNNVDTEYLYYYQQVPPVPSVPSGFVPPPQAPP